MTSMNYIVVTGGAGFIGSNLIDYLLKKTKYNIISYDNYFTGTKKNHIKNIRVRYIKGDTKVFSKKFRNYKNKIKVIFHFAEFSRIAQSFENFNSCVESNIYGTMSVVNFCLENKIKIIYSATSASLGNKGLDQNLSPYAFSKSFNMNLIMNYNEWFKLNYEIIYFYNVYGPRQIKDNNMAAVVGIFENCYEKGQPMPVVKPGSQTRKFTHVKDTVKICYQAWKKNLNRHYSISSQKEFSIFKLAKNFGGEIKMVPARRGERFKSSIIDEVRNKKIYNLKSNINLENYIDNFKKKVSK